MRHLQLVALFFEERSLRLEKVTASHREGLEIIEVMERDDELESSSTAASCLCKRLYKHAFLSHFEPSFSADPHVDLLLLGLRGRQERADSPSLRRGSIELYIYEPLLSSR